MKIECLENKVIIYLYRYLLSLDQKEQLNNEIKNLFVKLIKVYHLHFFGYNKVYIYYHHNYGYVLEIENIYEGELNDIIDLKIIIADKSKMQFEFEDKYFNNLNYNNGKYYLDLDNIDDIYPYLEFGKLIYCSK